MSITKIKHIYVIKERTYMLEVRLKIFLNEMLCWEQSEWLEEIGHELSIEAGEGMRAHCPALPEMMNESFHNKKLHKSPCCLQVGKLPLVLLFSLKLSIWKSLILFLLTSPGWPPGCVASPLYSSGMVGHTPLLSLAFVRWRQGDALQATEPNSEGNMSSPALTRPHSLCHPSP